MFILLLEKVRVALFLHLTTYQLIQTLKQTVKIWTILNFVKHKNVFNVHTTGSYLKILLIIDFVFHFDFLAGLISTTISINSDQQFPVNSTESVFDISFKPTSTLMADVQKSGAKNNTFGMKYNTWQNSNLKHVSFNNFVMTKMIVKKHAIWWFGLSPPSYK